MTLIEPAGAGLVQRVRNMLVQPRAEWEAIATERTSLGALLTGYVAPLAAIAALCGFIGLVVFGVGAFGVTVRVPLIPGLIGAVAQIALTLGWVAVVGIIIKALAPTFGSEPDEMRANQLAAYSSTAAIVGSFAQIVPALGIIGIIGAIYSLVLLYIGVPRLMKTPDDKRLPYFLAIIAAAIVAGLVASLVVGAARSVTGLGGGFVAAAPPAQGEVTLPNGQSVDLSELERAAKQMEELAANPQAAQAAAAASMDQLRTLLPESLPGLARTEISTSAAGLGLAQAEATYEGAEGAVELRIVDLGATGAFAAMAGAFGAQGSREDADGYERVGPVNGRMTMEKLDRAAGRAEYGLIASDRILIQAEGRGVDVARVKAAVEAVGVERADALAIDLASNP